MYMYLVLIICHVASIKMTGNIFLFQMDIIIYRYL